MKNKVFARFDLADWLVIVGVILLAVMMYQIFGWSGVTGFFGLACGSLGIYLAATRQPKKEN